MDNNNVDIEKLNFEAINNLSSLILENERQYTLQVAGIAKQIANNNKIKVVLIAGPSASGKTTSSNILKLNLEMLGKKVVTISLDDFFLPRDKTPRLADGSFDFENVKSLDLAKLNNFIDELLSNGTSKMPKFNFLDGKPEEHEMEISIDEKTILIFEGLHALNPEVVKHNPENIFKIYINLTNDYSLEGKTILSFKEVRLLRRITRDYYSRGHSIEATLKQWKHVIEGEKLYIDPYKDNANIKINSSHIYEVLLYANYTKKILKKELPLLNNEQFLKKAKELISILNNFEPIDSSEIPTTSLLWEFVSCAE